VGAPDTVHMGVLVIHCCPAMYGIPGGTTDTLGPIGVGAVRHGAPQFGNVPFDTVDTVGMWPGRGCSFRDHISIPPPKPLRIGAPRPTPIVLLLGGSTFDTNSTLWVSTGPFCSSVPVGGICCNVTLVSPVHSSDSLRESGGEWYSVVSEPISFLSSPPSAIFTVQLIQYDSR
jgi:hypothetical protein